VNTPLRAGLKHGTIRSFSVVETPVRAAARLTELDGIRAVALARVITWHATGWAWTTWIVSAVPTMFGVTGALMARTARAHGTAAMMRRRLVRFYPAWLAYGAVVLLISRQSRSETGPLVDFLVPLRTPTSEVAGEWFTSALWYVSSYLWVVVLSPALLWLASRWGYVPAVCMAACTLWLSWHGMDSAGHWWKTTDVVLYCACATAGMAWESRGASSRALAGLLVASTLTVVTWAFLRWPVDGVVNNDHGLHLLVGAGWAATFLLVPRVLRRVAMSRPARMLNRASFTVYLWHSSVAWTAWRFLPDAVDGVLRPTAVLALTALSVTAIVPGLAWIETIRPGHLRRPATMARAAVLLGVTAVLSLPAVQNRIDFHASAVDQPLPPSAAPVIAPVAVDKSVTDFLETQPPGLGLPTEEMQRAIERHEAEKELGGLRAVVISGDGRTWTGFAGGMAGLARKSAVGSITKTFTTSLVMAEVASGTMGLDDRVGDLGIGFGHPDITVRQLLTHTSGIAKVTENRVLLEDGTTPEEVVAWAGRRPLAFGPGTRVSYSTTGFAVLGLYLERVTGRTFEDLVTERIAVPYGYELEFFRGRYRSIGFATGGILIRMDDLADWIARYVHGRSVPGAPWDWEFRGTTGIGVHGYCPCEGKSFTALGHMGGRTFATVDADGTVVVIDSDGILVNENYESTQSLAQELRLLTGGGRSKTKP